MKTSSVPIVNDWPERFGEQLSKKTEEAGFQGSGFNDYPQYTHQGGMQMCSNDWVLQQKIDKEETITSSAAAAAAIAQLGTTQFKSVTAASDVVSDLGKLVADLNTMLAKGRGKIKTEETKDPWTVPECDPWAKSALANKEKSAEPINDGRGFPLRKEDEQAQIAYDYQQQWQSENWQSSIEYETQVRVKKEKSARTAAETLASKHEKQENEKFNKLKAAIIEKSEIDKLNEQIKSRENKDKEIVRLAENVIMNIKGTWEKITFTGDSGAVDHVITPEAGKAFEIKETAASKAGFGFRAANGSPIKIFGERKLNGVTESGAAFRMNCQVTNVKKNLASFVKMVNEGNDIVMSQKGSFIKNVNSGQVIKLDLNKGTPQFDVWVKKIEENEVSNVENASIIDDSDSVSEDVSAFHRLEMLI